MTTRSRSIAQENRIAKTLSGKRVRGSGCYGFRPGDVKTDQFLVEGKTTQRESYSLKLATLEKISAEADRLNREPLFVVTFETAAPLLRDWVMVPLHVFQERIK